MRKDMRNNREEWKESAKEVRELKREAREQAWKEYLDEAINEKDDTKVYKIIRSLNGSPGTNSTNEALVHNNRTITSDIRKADTFVKHYAAVSRHNFTKEERDVNRQAKKILSKNSADDSRACCNDFTMAELNKALKKMNKKGAPGEDDIPATFLAALGTKAKIILLDILNFSFNTGQIPQTWRNAVIIPLLKAMKPASQLSSYRPIALTSCVVKLFERMIANRIATMAENNGWFHRYQAGFRKGRSCTDQILRLVQQIDDGFQKKQKSILALLDLSKAYDMVWQQKLIVTMHEAGVPVKFLRWIFNFLQNRQARVRLNNAEGKTAKIRQGLPQGSVLAPLLFLFYINTLAPRLPESNTNSFFADDISILCYASSLEEAEKKTQEAVDIVAAWAKEYKMDLSTKSEVTFFSMKPTEAKWKPNVTIGGSPIKFEPSPRLLGVHLDRTLAFTKQTETVVKKVGKKCRMLGAVANSEWGWRKKELTRIYNSQVRPVLDYGGPAWQPWLSPSNVEALERANQRALGMVTGQSVGSSREAIRAEAGVCDYATIRKRNILIAREKALRSSEDHPARIAVSNDDIKQRLAIREGFRSTADKLAEFLPPPASLRKPIDLSATNPWEDHKDIKITPADNSTKKSATSDEELRSETISRIRDQDKDFTIYTDGSASAGLWDGGSAAVITTGDPETPTVLATIMAKGSAITCSTEEEVAALQLAKSWIEENAPANSKVLICTDSNALCKALENPDLGEIATMKRALEKLPADIHITWVPAHVNVPGNELADQAAKQATQLDAPTRGISFSAAKQLIRRNIVDPPIKHDQSRAIYQNYKLKNDEGLKCRADQTLIAKIRTGHWRKFRAYQSRVDNGLTDPNCKFCPGKKHNLIHWMTDCQATDELRHRLFGTQKPGLIVLATEPVKMVQMSRISQF